MRVLPYAGEGRVYTCRAHLVLGDWSRIEDVNALVDAGADPGLVDFLESAPTGVGKRRVERLVLTHGHYDHVIMLDAVRARWAPEVLAFGGFEGADRALADGERIRLGDREFEVVHAPCHTDDSICLYCETERVIFAGDTPLVNLSPDARYPAAFVEALDRLASRPVETIYFGHGAPLTEGCGARLAESLEHARRGRTG